MPDDNDTERNVQQPWWQTWGLTAAMLGGAALLAAGFGAGWLLHSQPSPSAPKSTSSAPATPAAAPPPAAGAPAQDDDDNQFVAIAFPPSSPQRATFGTAGTEARARTIAVNECKSDSGDQDCMVAQSAHYGCVTYAVDAAGSFAGGKGPDAESAHRAAVDQMPNAIFVSAAQCAK
jgi:hypothetical protein